jgi:hypothetical protein
MAQQRGSSENWLNPLSLLYREKRGRRKNNVLNNNGGVQRFRRLALFAMYLFSLRLLNLASQPFCNIPSPAKPTSQGAWRGMPSTG